MSVYLAMLLVPIWGAFLHLCACVGIVGSASNMQFVLFQVPREETTLHFFSLRIDLASPSTPGSAFASKRISTVTSNKVTPSDTDQMSDNLSQMCVWPSVEDVPHERIGGHRSGNDWHRAALCFT